MERITLSGGTGTIPNGQLFACELTVASALATGPHVIDNAPSASSATAEAFPTTGIDGVVTITNCAADCNGSGQVLIPEVQRASQIFLSAPICSPSAFTQSCPNADMITIDGQVTINEVSRASCLFQAGTCAKTCTPPQ
jgi:hypothetical protein